MEKEDKMLNLLRHRKVVHFVTLWPHFSVQHGHSLNKKGITENNDPSAWQATPMLTSVLSQELSNSFFLISIKDGHFTLVSAKLIKPKVTSKRMRPSGCGRCMCV